MWLISGQQLVSWSKNSLSCLSGASLVPSVSRLSYRSWWRLELIKPTAIWCAPYWTRRTESAAARTLQEQHGTAEQLRIILSWGPWEAAWGVLILWSHCERVPYDAVISSKHHVTDDAVRTRIQQFCSDHSTSTTGGQLRATPVSSWEVGFPTPDIQWWC